MREWCIGKVVANGNSKQVTIPRPMLHRLGWQLGTRLLVEERAGCLVIAELEYALRERVQERIAQGLPAEREASS